MSLRAVDEHRLRGRDERRAGQRIRHAVGVHAGAAAAGSVPVEYQRDDSDRITLAVNPDRPGFIRVLESWDPGWRATVDGNLLTPVPADDVFLCVPVGAGAHRVTFEFSTPGARAGAWVSAGSLAGLALLAMVTKRRRS